MAVSVTFIAAGAACAVIAAVPFSSIQPLGELVRRVDDVTPERHARLVHVCLAFAAWGMTTGVLLWRSRAGTAEWLNQLTADLAAAVKQAPAIMRSWGAAPWLIVAVGIALRIMHLNDSMAYDESYTFVNLARQPIYVGIADYTSTNNHLLNTLLMHCSWRLFGDAEWALRLPVFIVGSLLPLLIWIWAARWLGWPAALIAAALAAVSPLLITYSTDARGYILVTFAAVALDDAASRRWNPRHSKPLAWLQIVLAAALGLCAMPIMLYALVSVGAWMLLWRAFDLNGTITIAIEGARSPASPKKPGFSFALQQLRDAARHNLWPLVAGALAFCLIVGSLYAPAYIFRGTRAMHDQILKPVSIADQARAQWDSLLGAWDWWTTGFPPAWAWLLGLIAGVLFFRSTRGDCLRWLALPVAMLLLHLAGQVAPPPRVYIILLPSITLAVAAGWIAAVSLRGRFARQAGVVLAGIVLAGGIVYAATHPVLIYPAERTSFVSVREAMTDLKARIESEPSVRHRLIAPLPCDLPSIFYRERERIGVEVNGEPKTDEVLWLLTRHGETPEQVLGTPLINLPALAMERRPFDEVSRFQTLVLYRSPPR